MTEIQKIELELLEYFIRICEKLNLKFYLVCGSALGAVKYNGFIPWDDDIDVALPRPDYEKFCKEANKFLPKHIFVQNYITEKTYPRMYTKLRNSKTTYMEKSVSHINMNHGVFIDIFPLDGYPSDLCLINKLEKEKKVLKLKVECVFNTNYGITKNLFFSIERLLGFHKNTDVFLSKLTTILSKWFIYDSKLWCNHGNWQGKLEYAPREQYGEGVMMKFEGLDVRVPTLYDEYLTQKYGDWRADLPVEEQKGHHYYEILDLNRPYTDYIDSISKDGSTIKLKTNI